MAESVTGKSNKDNKSKGKNSKGEKDWNRRLKETLAFKMRNGGDCTVRESSDKKWKSLKRWQTRQRTMFKQKTLQIEKVMLLWFAGFIFNINEREWDDALEFYVMRREGDDLLLSDKTWLKTQTKAFEKETLSARRVLFLTRFGLLPEKAHKEEEEHEEEDDDNDNDDKPVISSNKKSNSKKSALSNNGKSSKSGGASSTVMKEEEEKNDLANWKKMFNLAVTHLEDRDTLVDKKLLEVWLMEQAHSLIYNTFSKEQAKLFESLFSAQLEMSRKIEADVASGNNVETDAEGDDDDESENVVDDEEEEEEKEKGEEEEEEEEEKVQIQTNKPKKAIKRKFEKKMEEEEEVEEEEEEKPIAIVKKKKKMTPFRSFVTNLMSANSAASVASSATSASSATPSSTSSPSGANAVAALKKNYSTPSLTTELAAILQKHHLHENTMQLLRSLTEDEKDQLFQSFSMGQRAAIRLTFNT